MFRIEKRDSLLDTIFTGTCTLELLESMKTRIEGNLMEYFQLGNADNYMTSEEREEFIKYLVALEAIEKMIKVQKQLLAMQNLKEKVKVRSYLKKLLSSAAAFVKGLGGFANAIKAIIEVVKILRELFGKLSLRAVHGSFIFCIKKVTYC